MEENNIKIENIFTEADINTIWSSTNPTSQMFELIEKVHRKQGQIDIDNNIISAYSEFHVNNLVFLKENFTLNTEVICKLLNLFNVLITLKNNERDSPRGTEPNFAHICKTKLHEFKQGLIQLNLVTNEAVHGSGFYLHKTELGKLLEYINTFYVPFIRLYYHFANIERITENKKIEVIINRPLPVPPLNVAVMQISEKNQIEAEKHEELEDKNIDVIFL
jgi:hypothetical protein